MRVPWASDWLSVHLAAVFLSSSPGDLRQPGGGRIKGEAFVTRARYEHPLEGAQRRSWSWKAAKFTGNGDELRTTACAATACTPTEPPRGERLRGPQARLAVLASGARSNRRVHRARVAWRGRACPQSRSDRAEQVSLERASRFSPWRKCHGIPQRLLEELRRPTESNLPDSSSGVLYCGYKQCFTHQ